VLQRKVKKIQRRTFRKKLRARLGRAYGSVLQQTGHAHVGDVVSGHISRGRGAGPEGGTRLAHTDPKSDFHGHFIEKGKPGAACLFAPG